MSAATVDYSEFRFSMPQGSCDKCIVDPVSGYNLCLNTFTIKTTEIDTSAPHPKPEP